MFEKLLDLLRKRIGDTAIIVLLIAGITITTIWLLYAFLIGRNDSSRDAYYERMLAVCEEVSRTVARLATAGPADDGLTDAVVRFEELKFGDLRLFESKRLERAMVRFRTFLDSPPPGPEDLISAESVQRGLAADRVGARLAAYAVGEACREMIQPTLGDQLWSLLFRRPPDTGEGAPTRGPTPASH